MPTKTESPHSEIEVVARLVLEVYAQQRAYLASKPTPYLEELIHRAEDQRNHTTFTIRVGAEINLAAASMVLQERRAG